ncbi:hypothetical protein UPYG_G00173960 [Umbra pygmaea]|uniref:Sas10 C-terminal domain-containing protein n=1 Tax=Umbra pygmaea TaxID=75934 RepID=A0ABD0X670_UMBPY
MVRAQRKKRVPKVKKTEEFDKDDPEAYKDMPVPDKRSSQYTRNEVDEFHDDKISKLMARGVQMDSDQEDEDQEEVMPLDLSDSDDDDDEEEEEADMDSDLDRRNDDDELPNDLAWGNKKKMYYDSDYVATKGKSQQEVEEEDQEEEEEAKNIQRRLAADLSEEDYDLNLLQEFAVEEEEEVEKEERIVKDLKQLSQKEKIKLLKKESPELLDLMQDFKAKLAELKDELQPLLKMVNNGQIPPGKGANYLKTKQLVYLNYCTNISFYLVLKAKRVPAHNHPVIERLLTYRNLINEMGEVDARLAPQLRKLLSAERKNKATRKPAGNKRVMLSEEPDTDLDEDAALDFYRKVEERLKLKKKGKTLQAKDGLEDVEDYEEWEEDPNAKRGITYQMAKNKGLTPKRKKINRNPRVKNRERFRRAIIRRKGQVREVCREETRYSGEMSGIRAGVKKSIKLK